MAEVERLKNEHRDAMTDTEKRNARTRERTIALIAEKVSFTSAFFFFFRVWSAGLTPSSLRPCRTRSWRSFARNCGPAPRPCLRQATPTFTQAQQGGGSSATLLLAETSRLRPSFFTQAQFHLPIVVITLPLSGCRAGSR